MNFINRGEAPRYKGSPTPSPSSGGLLSGFWRLFGGGSQPMYRVRDDASTPTTAPSQAGWMGASQPLYATAPVDAVTDRGTAATDRDGDIPNDVVTACAEVDVSDDVPTEIHIW